MEDKKEGESRGKDLMIYLTKDQLIEINRNVVMLSNDPHGVLNEANLSHLLDALPIKYINHSDSDVLKASFLLDYLANKGHVFIEGNKRTAETATITFLHLNNHFFEEQNQEKLSDFVLRVARNQESLTSIFKWLKQRINAL